MSRWLDRAEQLTYEGERITQTVDVGEGGVVVTTHRLLVFDPDGEGAVFSDVDLPNVIGVTEAERGDTQFLTLGAKAGAVGTVLLLAGALVPLDALVGDVSFGQAGGRIGIGGVVGVLESVLGILRSLDDLMLVVGALAFLVAAGALGWYLQTRERQLRIERAGAEPLVLALGEGDLAAGTLDALRQAVEPGA